MGTLAVDGFFLMSGYLVAGSWMRTGRIVPYLRKRILRIYPAFIVVTFAEAFILAPALSAAIHPFPLKRQLALCFRGIVTLFGYDSWAGPFVAVPANPFPRELAGTIWTIKYEFACYLLVALLGSIGALRRPRLVLVLAAASLILYGSGLASHRAGSALAGGTWAQFLAFFMVGSLVYSYRGKFRPSIVAALGAAVVVCVALLSPAASRWCLPVFGGYLVFAAALVPSRLSTWGRYGDFSYGIYLWGFSIEQVLVHIRPDISPGALIACAWPLTVIAGILSWFAIEKRFLSQKRVAEVEAAPTPDVAGAGETLTSPGLE